jgi:hypothetical protein
MSPGCGEETWGKSGCRRQDGHAERGGFPRELNLLRGLAVGLGWNWQLNRHARDGRGNPGAVGGAKRREGEGGGVGFGALAVARYAHWAMHGAAQRREHFCLDVFTLNLWR